MFLQRSSLSSYYYNAELQWSALPGRQRWSEPAGSCKAADWVVPDVKPINTILWDVSPKNNIEVPPVYDTFTQALLVWFILVHGGSKGKFA